VLLPMKILVVDDHVLIREALRGVLGELEKDATILEASDSRQAMQRIAETPELDLILLDLNLPDRSGFEVLAALRENHPAISVVMLSASNDRHEIARALDLGALGFIPKSASREVMLGAFRLIFSGGIYVPPEILGHTQAASPPVPHASARSSRLPPAAAALGLTDRQMEVLALMMQGKSNKAICRALDLAEPTVKNHVTAILRALKASNRTEAVIAAGALGLASMKDGE
jgi:DNA-binding NarL/FixJ family response regulator